MFRTCAIRYAATAAAFLLAMPLHAQSETDTQSAMPLAGATLPAETLREGRFRVLDVDGNQYLTSDEIGKDEPILKSQFHSLDRNNDGRLSKAEYVYNGRPPEPIVQ